MGFVPLSDPLSYSAPPTKRSVMGFLLLAWFSGEAKVGCPFGPTIIGYLSPCHALLSLRLYHSALPLFSRLALPPFVVFVPQKDFVLIPIRRPPSALPVPHRVHRWLLRYHLLYISAILLFLPQSSITSRVPTQKKRSTLDYHPSLSCVAKTASPRIKRPYKTNNCRSSSSKSKCPIFCRFLLIPV